MRREMQQKIPLPESYYDYKNDVLNDIRGMQI
jgi:hypothetical protein